MVSEKVTCCEGVSGSGGSSDALGGQADAALAKGSLARVGGDCPVAEVQDHGFADA
jgi:hypothetical protein